jgi:hypothetical protein
MNKTDISMDMLANASKKTKRSDDKPSEKTVSPNISDSGTDSAASSYSNINQDVNSKKFLEGLSITIGSHNFKVLGCKKTEFSSEYSDYEYDILIPRNLVDQLVIVSDKNHRNLYPDSNMIDTSNIDEETKNAGKNIHPVKASFTDAIKSKIEVYDGQRRFVCTKRNDCDLLVTLASKPIPKTIQKKVSLSSNKAIPTGFLMKGMGLREVQKNIESLTGRKLTVAEMFEKHGDEYGIKTESSMRAALQAANMLDFQIFNFFGHESHFTQGTFEKLRRLFNSYLKDLSVGEGDVDKKNITIMEAVSSLIPKLHENLNSENVDITPTACEFYGRERARVCFATLRSEWTAKKVKSKNKVTEEIAEGITIVSSGDPDGAYTLSVNNADLPQELLKEALKDLITIKS